MFDHIYIFMSNTPVPGADHKVSDVPDADGASQDVSELGVRVAVGGGQWRHVDGISDWLITGGVDHVAQSLLGVLNAAALRVSVPQEHQLLLLPGPEASDTLFIHLQHESRVLETAPVMKSNTHLNPASP